MVMRLSLALIRIPAVSPWRKSSAQSSTLVSFRQNYLQNGFRIPDQLDRQSEPLNARVITNLFVLLISVNLDRYLLKENNF